MLKDLPAGGVLGGETALAILIGHRQSYDFDVFYEKPISKAWLPRLKKLFGQRLVRPVIDTSEELMVVLAPNTKLTLLSFPFPPLHPPSRTPFISLFDFRDLASNKAYAIGRRGAWRDYVDLYFLLRDHLSLPTIMMEAEKRFSGVFSTKLFLEQLQYLEDVQEETVEFIGPKISRRTVQQFFMTEVKRYVRRRLK